MKSREVQLRSSRKSSRLFWHPALVAFLIAFAVALFWLNATRTGWCQDNDDKSALTVEMINSRRTTAMARDLDEETKSQLTRHFDQAIQYLNQADDFRKRRQTLQAELANSPQATQVARNQLEQPSISTEPEFSEGSSVAELEQSRRADEERFAEFVRQIEALDSRLARRADRRPQMPQLIEATQQRLDEAQRAFERVDEDGGRPEIEVARKTEQESLLLAVRQELELYRVEQQSLETLAESLTLQRDLLARERGAYEKRLQRWGEILTETRRRESERQRSEADLRSRLISPALRVFAEKSAELAMERADHQSQVEVWRNDLNAARQTLSQTSDKFKQISEKERLVGLTTAIGLELRDLRFELPKVSRYRERQRSAEQEIIALQSQKLKLDNDRKELSDLEPLIDSLVMRAGISADEENEFRSSARNELNLQRQYLDDLRGDYDASLRILYDLDSTCRQLISLVGQFESHIDEKVLWIRSMSPIDWSLPQTTVERFHDLATHREWLPVARFMASDAVSGDIAYPICAAAVLGLWLLSWRVSRFTAQLRASATGPLDSGTPQAVLTLGLVLLTSLPIPLICGFLAWRLSDADIDLARAMSSGLWFAAISSWLVISFRGLCSSNGFLQAFLEWPIDVVRLLKRKAWIYLVTVIPLASLAMMLSGLEEAKFHDSLGRLAFIAFCGMLSYLLMTTFNATGLVMSQLSARDSTGLAVRFHWAWYWPIVWLPIFFAILSVLGYQYTAEQLMFRLERSLAATVGLVILYALILKWTLAARRKLALQQARERRQAAVQTTTSLSEDGASGAIPVPPIIEEPAVDLTLVKRQVFQFVRGGIIVLFLVVSWGVWKDVVPAVQGFTRTPLWSNFVSVSEIVETPDGLRTREVLKQQPFTLGQLFGGLSVLLIAVWASRNLPGPLELSILQRLPLDRGSRNAFKILSGYFLLGTGIFVASKIVGLQWNSIQWLVAALTVGLGFGLQEIFANFVAGLIILFERPMRVGDIVTVDGVTGVVSRIHIRATTITDWDRKEFIVPNKEFVTGRLMNWTLTDNVNRVVLKVGIAYDADVERALAILLQIAKDHPLVLTDPSPVVSFESFGDSTLDLMLRIFLAGLSDRVAVVTAIHLEINRQFRSAGIEIAYPQRDLHLRSVPENFRVETGKG